MSNGNTTVSLTLKVRGQQAKQVLEQMNKAQERSANELLRTNRYLESVLRQQAQQTNIQAKNYHQLNTLVNQQRSTLTQNTAQTQANLRTNQLLERVLQQQVRQSSQLTQQTRNQNRDYRLQVDMLRQQAAAAERLRQQLEGARRAQQGGAVNNNGGGFGGRDISTVAGVAGGVYAAGSIGAKYLSDPRDYMRQISYATDTALAGKDMSVPEYNKKVIEMEGFVRNATVNGGSSPQQMTQALNTITASNVYDFNELNDVLLQVSRTAFASGADANDVAQMFIAQKNFGLTDSKKANDQAMKAGQYGSFELRDMARYMPDLLTQGRGAGYIGDTGYRDLLTMMQLSKKTSGTAEGAAVNLSDLLGSFSQHHLGLSFAKHIKLDKGDPIAAYGVSKKKSGFDWTTYAANMREKGVGEVEAAAMLMQRQMNKNKKYQEYQKKAKAALANNDDAAYLENLQAATQIVAQSEIGKIFHNKQALMAFTGITMNMGEGGFKERLDQGIEKSEGTIQTSHERHSAQEYGKDGSLDTARFNAKVDVYNGMDGWWGDLKQGLADFASSNAGIAAAASAAVTGLTMVGAAAGIAALTMRRGTPPIPTVPPVPAGGVRGAAAAAGRSSVGALAGSTVGRLAVGAGVGVAATAGYATGTAIRDSYLTTESGQNFDHAMGGTIATIMSKLPDWMGGDTAREALEAEMNNLAGLSEQQNKHQEEVAKQTAQAVKELQKLPQAIGNAININVSGFSNNLNTGDRSGTVATKPLIFKDPLI